MKTSKTAVLICLCTLIVLTTFCGASNALTGNTQPNATPYVGLVVLFSDTARTQPISYSTGVLISPTLVLTAGHSVIGGAAVSVCFSQAPSTDQTIYNGVAIAYPEYLVSIQGGAKPSEALRTSDVGLIILDTPVTEVSSFPCLPTTGLADTLPVNTALKVIGYGVYDELTPRGHDANTWIGTMTRNEATVQLLSSNFQGSNNYLKCSANAAQSKGGIAYGDSGGPVMYSDDGETIVLGINAYVNNENCAGVTFHTRLDNPQVLAWINGYQ